MPKNSFTGAAEDARLLPTNVYARSKVEAERLTAAARIGGPNVRVTETAPRSFDVYRFAGDPSRAAQLLGWRARTFIEQGFAALATALRAGRGGGVG